MTLFTRHISAVLTIGLWAAILAGCGGGGASVGTSAARSQSQSPALTTQSAKSAQGNVTFTIGIKPKATAVRVTPKYVSPSTQSLRILTDGANPVVVNLTPASPNCTPNPALAGAFVCTASLNVSAGDHTFTAAAFDLTGAGGSVLSTNTTGTVDVKPTGTTIVSLVLEGVVHDVILTLATTNPPIGIPAGIVLTATLEDADGNLIVGPARYAHPVTLTTTDATRGPLSKTVLNSPADASGILVDYTGANSAPITYSATSSGLPAAVVIDAVLTPGAPAKHLFVANLGEGSVSVFDIAGGSRPLTITGDGLGGPSGVAVDAAGKLYVANQGANTISIFDTTRGNAALPAITGGGLNDPLAMTVDASGKLYVANFGSFPELGSVSIFDTAHGNAALPSITGGGLDWPQGVAIDGAGKLYVLNYGNPWGSVSVFDTAHGNAALPPISGGGVTNSGNLLAGLAVDAGGKLYLANYGVNATFSVIVIDTAHGNAVLPAITGGGLNVPTGVAVDATGKLYVANLYGGASGSGSISVFDTVHGNAALPAITGGGLNLPVGLVVH